MTGPTLDRRGWIEPAAGITHAASPNFDARPSGTAPTLLVIHNISLPPGVFGGTEVVDFFQNRLNYEAHRWLERLRGMTVSAHFFVRRDGGIVQLVSTDARAWHAGVSRFESRENCNDFSIGIEVEGTDTTPYTDDQYRALAQLSQVLCARYPLRAVRGHEHIAPGRKTDPGSAFDWPRFARLAGWPRRLMPAT
ncbi:MAG: 1,6-anhydro-N-acetylmuramyl-L-alanine amidase AmpD [Candidimonas sp.]|nr:MAG: 1,6-anhydro-N-acetylmuramyl-L-alanine amidase AmpD [Candidimonas sp.]